MIFFFFIYSLILKFIFHRALEQSCFEIMTTNNNSIIPQYGDLVEICGSHMTNYQIAVYLGSKLTLKF